MTSPFVTFLVPCYQYGQYLRECVASILAQSYGAIEILILDDASTDDTPEVAGQLVAENPEKVFYHRNETNIGHLENYNRGIRQARGELVWLISADDCLGSTEVLERFVEAFRRHPSLGYAFCRVRVINEHSEPQDKYIPARDHPGLPGTATFHNGREFFKHLVRANFVPAPGALARKACYERFGYFHPALTHSGDWYNWLVFALEWDVFYDPEPGVHYRKHQANMHVTYEKPRHAVDNSLLCYTELEKVLAANPYPRALKWRTQLAKIQYKKKYGVPLNTLEKVFRLYGKLCPF